MENNEFTEQNTGGVPGFITSITKGQKEQWKYQEQWDKRDYDTIAGNLTPKDAYTLGYEDAIYEIKEWLEEELTTRYDWSTGSPKENGIDSEYNDKWDFLSAFYNVFEK